MEDAETIANEPIIGSDNVTYAWNFTCPNITTNLSSCNVTFGDDEDEYSYDYDTSSTNISFTFLLVFCRRHCLFLVLIFLFLFLFLFLFFVFLFLFLLFCFSNGVLFGSCSCSSCSSVLYRVLFVFLVLLVLYLCFSSCFCSFFVFLFLFFSCSSSSSSLSFSSFSSSSSSFYSSSSSSSFSSSSFSSYFSSSFLLRLNILIFVLFLFFSFPDVLRVVSYFPFLFSSSLLRRWPYYDYDTSLAAVPLTELIPVSLTYGLTLVLGALGNALVMMSYRFRRLQSVTNVFLVSLATADLSAIIIITTDIVLTLPPPPPPSSSSSHLLLSSLFFFLFLLLFFMLFWFLVHHHHGQPRYGRSSPHLCLRTNQGLVSSVHYSTIVVPHVRNALYFWRKVRALLRTLLRERTSPFLVFFSILLCFEIES